MAENAVDDSFFVEVRRNECGFTGLRRAPDCGTRPDGLCGLSDRGEFLADFVDDLEPFAGRNGIRRVFGLAVNSKIPKPLRQLVR